MKNRFFICGLLVITVIIVSTGCGYPGDPIVINIVNDSGKLIRFMSSANDEFVNYSELFDFYYCMIDAGNWAVKIFQIESGKTVNYIIDPGKYSAVTRDWYIQYEEEGFPDDWRNPVATMSEMDRCDFERGKVYTITFISPELGCSFTSE